MLLFHWQGLAQGLAHDLMVLVLHTPGGAMGTRFDENTAVMFQTGNFLNVLNVLMGFVTTKRQEQKY
jgi:hypothetical protein